LFRGGNTEGATEQWQAAVAADPKLGEAHNNLAVVYLQAGRLDDADREMKLAEKSGTPRESPVQRGPQESIIQTLTPPTPGRGL
jgi:Tfp pilus assembly protein PilF